MNNSFQLERGAATAAGISPAAIGRMVQRWEKEQLGIHSFMLLRHGKVLAEAWWKPYRPEYEHMLNSLSKSITSTGIGFAVQEGLLTTEDFLLDFFPEYRGRKLDPKMKKIQLKHLLTMSTGQVPSGDSAFRFADPVNAFLASAVQEEPGSFFRYNTAATYMLSVVLTRVTGQSLFDYLTPRLFEPLGMMDNIWWEQCPQGNSLGGYGLNLKTEDLAKFGQLYLNRGKWNGKQLLDAGWIDTASAKHINNGVSTQTPWLDTPDNTPEPADLAVSDWNRGYGYQFWRCIPKNVYRADGAFGQYVLVMPEQDMVLAITAGTTNMGAILCTVWEELLPDIQNAPLPSDSTAQAKLDKLLASLTLSTVLQTAAPSFCGEKTYQLAKNPLGLTRVSFSFRGDGDDLITVTKGEKAYTFAAGKDCWLTSDLDFQPEGIWPFHLQFFPNIACSAGWTAEKEYTLTVVANRMSYAQTAVCRFAGERVQIALTQNLCCPEPVLLDGSAL